MDDFSPVTFESSLGLSNTTPSSATTIKPPPPQYHPHHHHQQQHLQQQQSEDTLLDNNAYIEETKVIIPGIKVRAAKLDKLIEILIESFDEETGEVLPNIDFPRVFFLMHKWFMESDELANMIYDLYIDCEQRQQKPDAVSSTSDLVQQSTPASAASSNESMTPVMVSKQDTDLYQLKICHALSYWINKFPFHFALDMTLIEAVKRLSCLISNKGKLI